MKSHETLIAEHPCRQPVACGDVPLSFFHYQYTQIAKEWTSHLQYHAFRITGNKQVAEDIVQEAFLKLWQFRFTILTENPVGWLKKVVTNFSLQHLKRASIKLRIYKTFRQETPTYYSEVEERLIGKEKQYQLQQVYHQLSSQQQLVLHLSKDIGLKRNEIADRLQLSPNTVKVHLSRAVQFMKEHCSCLLLFAFFLGCNIIFFQSSNTKESLIDLLMNKQTSENLPEKIVSSKTYMHDLTNREPLPSL